MQGCRLALSMLLVGLNIAIGKLIPTGIPVYLFAALRFFIASLVLLPDMFIATVRRGLDRSACGGLFLQAFFGCFLFSLCMLHGVLLTSATSAGIITSATPSVIALLAWLRLRERIGTVASCRPSPPARPARRSSGNPPEEALR